VRHDCHRVPVAIHLLIAAAAWCCVKAVAAPVSFAQACSSYRQSFDHDRAGGSCAIFSARVFQFDAGKSKNAEPLAVAKKIAYRRL